MTSLVTSRSLSRHLTIFKLRIYKYLKNEHSEAIIGQKQELHSGRLHWKGIKLLSKLLQIAPIHASLPPSPPSSPPASLKPTIQRCLPISAATEWTMNKPRRRVRSLARRGSLNRHAGGFICAAFMTPVSLWSVRHTWLLAGSLFWCFGSFPLCLSGTKRGSAILEMGLNGLSIFP